MLIQMEWEECDVGAGPAPSSVSHPVAGGTAALSLSYRLLGRHGATQSIPEVGDLSFHIIQKKISRSVRVEILVKSLRGCEKWILQEILHRFSDPKKSELLFSSKEIILKIWKIFFGGNFQISKDGQ